MSKNTEHLFKPYHPNQVLLLPPSLSEKIPSHHPVRVVSEIIDKLDLTPILARYPGGGSSSYHPRMML
ncbi:MAG: transposase, partial [Bacteroidetes bacterium]|nr:transposase [Bacteroidota bacterium]